MLGNRKSQHSFAQIPDVKGSRSQFNRSFPVKDTFDFDYLVPIFVDEVVPGDVANVRIETFARLATQKVPIMDNMMIDFFFFFVPNRLVWDNWEKFCGAQNNPGDSTSYLIPSMASFPSGGPEVNSIWDKFGLPTDIPNAWALKNALIPRGYNLIWNEWFRDQNLQNSLPVHTDDGPDPLTDYALRKRGKRHDYFTSALPWPQKGAAVQLPLGTFAPITVVPNATNSNPMKLVDKTTLGPLNNTSILTNAAGEIQNTAQTNDALIDPNGRLRADLSSATAATINQLRQAFQVQGLLELDARGGTRYVEILQAHYNVTSPDFRLQRPEYLGGGSQKIHSHAVPQTAPTSGTNAQAQLAAFGTSSSSQSNIGFTKSFVEHGYIYALVCARADISYQQGVNRMWSRQTRYDFFWPKLQQLGEQAVLNKEIYVQGTSADENVFGYQERYAEYRYYPAMIKGEFRSTFAQSLDYWHMAEEFSSLPALNATFIEQNTPIERAIAVTDAPHLLFDSFVNYKSARGMMAYSVPVTLGRF